MTLKNGLIALLVVFVVSTVLVFGCGRSGPKAEMSNLILIVVDTLRPDHLGCYGYLNIATPVMDGLAQNGTLFEQAITPVPVTVPAFASLLTSTFPPTHGVRDNGVYALGEGMLTLAEVLREEGFRTAAFLGSSVVDSIYRLDQGFSTYDDDFGDSYFPNHPEYVPLAEELRGTQRRAVSVNDRALRWIRANRREPFFVLIHYFDPHAHYDPPPPFDSLYAENLYDGEISYTDYILGEFLNGLATFSIPGKTLMVLTSDHGEGLMEHGESQHGLLTYDSTLRVPLIFACPGVIPSGLRIPDQVNLVDLAPTVLTFLGVKRPKTFQGTDLSLLLKGGAVQTPEAVYFETFRPRLSYGWSHLQGVRTGEWKYIRAPEPELYDLVKDNRELDNLAGTGLPKEKELTDRLAMLLESFQSEDRARATEVRVDQAARERLQSLGYVAGAGEMGDTLDEALPDPKHQMEAFNRRQLASYHSRIATAFLDVGRPDVAIEGFERALEIEPGSPLRHVNLGAAYAWIKEDSKAIAAYRRALELNPGYVPAHMGLAHLHELRGDTAAAIEAYHATLEAAPRHPDALASLSMLEIRRGRPENAVGILEEALEEDPDNATLLTYLVEALRRSEDFEKAATHLERLSVLQPLNPDTPYFLAATLVRLDRREEALRWYERAIELDPTLEDAYYNIACIHSLAGRTDEAIQWLRRALDHGFDDFVHMRQDADLDPLRSDRRFQALFPTGA